MPDLSALFRSHNPAAPLKGGHKKKANDVVIGQLSSDQRQFWFFEQKVGELHNQAVQMLQQNAAEHLRFTGHTTETRRNFREGQREIEKAVNRLRTVHQTVRELKNLLINANLPPKYTEGDYDLLICEDGCVIAKKSESTSRGVSLADLLGAMGGGGNRSPFESNQSGGGLGSILGAMFGFPGGGSADGGGIFGFGGNDAAEGGGFCDCGQPDCPVGTFFGRTARSQAEMNGEGKKTEQPPHAPAPRATAPATPAPAAAGAGGTSDPARKNEEAGG